MYNTMIIVFVESFLNSSSDEVITWLPKLLVMQQVA